MKKRIDLSMSTQPDDLTCGPTCLHSIYQYYRDPIELTAVIDEVEMLEEGGTLAANLGCHALVRGYQAVIHCFNLMIFDPTWFDLSGEDLKKKLRKQLEVKTHPKLRVGIEGYLRFLDLGGKLLFEDLNPSLLGRYVSKKIPIITGLSATHLYRCSRENPETSVYDDIGGEPAGHFVILTGYGEDFQEVIVGDPLSPNPLSAEYEYPVEIHHLISSILLGVVTYDANLLVIQPKNN
ncbi:MAG: hypothetical protein ACOH5I_02555 [Oligoflexus sp.]